MRLPPNTYCLDLKIVNLDRICITKAPNGKTPIMFNDFFMPEIPLNTQDGPRDFEFECAFAALGYQPIVLCIGSDRVTGDCLGPIVGQMLVEKKANAFVYGTLSRPVTALNLEEAVRHIKDAHSDKKVLAVDSSVGRLADVGKIRVSFGSIAPGSADGKKLPKVGDVSITATVTDPRKIPLSAVRLGTVYALAEQISARIIKCLQ